jgi:hypothetical protein
MRQRDRAWVNTFAADRDTVLPAIRSDTRAILAIAVPVGLRGRCSLSGRRLPELNLVSLRIDDPAELAIL